MATSHQVVEENGEPEVIEDIPAPVEPPFDSIPLTDKKIKYINNKYVKVNAHMYDHKCDVKLKVGDSFFKGHRKVLADASDYFDAMFTHDMKEKEESVIELKELSSAGVSAMLDYFYHGSVSVEQDTVPNILEMGRFFHVDWILVVCCDYMVRHLSRFDYLSTMALADTFSLGELRWDICKYFSHNLLSLIQEEDFFKNTGFDFLFHFLMEGTHVDVSEFTLMQVVLKWVEFDEEKRQEHLLPLLRNIRFFIMDLEELEEIPQKVLDIKEIGDEIEEAKMYCLNIPLQCLKTGDKYCSRGARPTVVLSSFGDESGVVIYKDPYDEEANLFIERLGAPGLFVDYSTTNQTELGNFLFAAGGYSAECDEFGQYVPITSSSMYRFDPRDREWTQIATMAQPRASFSMCSSQNRIYVIGGVFHITEDYGEVKVLPLVEMYDPEENAWKPLPDLPHGCSDSAAAYCRNQLFVSGGKTSMGENSLSDLIAVKTVLSLAEGQDKWSPLPDMLYARQGHSMSAINDKLYVLGGYTIKEVLSSPTPKNCYTSEVFDIETQQWTELKSSPEELGHLYRHVGVIDTRIFFLSTEDGEVFFANYDTEKDEFSPAVNVGQGLSKVSVLSVGYPDQ